MIDDRTKGRNVAGSKRALGCRGVLARLTFRINDEACTLAAAVLSALLTGVLALPFTMPNASFVLKQAALVQPVASASFDAPSIPSGTCCIDAE